MYAIQYLDKVVDSILPAIPARNARQILIAINERLTVDPVGLGKPLRHGLKGHKRIRVGDWRVIYRINGWNVIVCDIVLRRDAYRD